MSASLQRISPLLQVKDLQSSLYFYTTVLGFKELWRDDGGFIILSRDGCDLFLGENQTKVDLRNVTARATNKWFASYDLHIHCAAGTVDSLWKEFKDAGASMPAAFASGPIDRDYGVRDFSILDPDGYQIVFGAPIEYGPTRRCS